MKKTATFELKSEGIKDAAEETEKLAEGLDDVKKSAPAAESGLKKIGNAMKGLGIISILAAGFMALKEALSRNQKVMDTVSTVMGTISNVFNQIVGALVDTVAWVTQSNDRFDALKAVVKNVIKVAFTPFKLTVDAIKLSIYALMVGFYKIKNAIPGNDETKKIKELNKEIKNIKGNMGETIDEAIDAGKEIGYNIGEAIDEVSAIYKVASDNLSKVSVKTAYEQADAATKAKNNSAIAAARQRKLIEEYDRQAEVQRQIRDNENATFEERIKANEDLSKILENQKTAMLANASIMVEAARTELAMNKDSVELKAALIDAEAEYAGVLATVTGFESEQKTNAVSLNNELKQSVAELHAEGLSGYQRELIELENAYNEKIKMAKKTGTDTTAIERQFAKQKADLAREQTNAQLEAFSGLASGLSALAGDNKELAVASAIIDTYVGANKAFAQGGVVGYVTAAGVIAAGLANVQKILAQDVGGDSASGGDLTPGTPAPEMVSGANFFQQSVDQEQPPVKAYVVTDEMSNSQDQLGNIRRRATI